MTESSMAVLRSIRDALQEYITIEKEVECDD